GFKQDSQAPTVDFATEVAGTYTVLISDATGDGNGTYRLSLSRSAITPGGLNPLRNGAQVTGELATARAEDRWTFTASTGETIVLRVGETVAGSKLSPQLRLFGPEGNQLLSSFGTAAAEVAVRATNSGTFTASVRDNNGSATTGGVNTGGYRLSLAKTGTP